MSYYLKEMKRLYEKIKKKLKITLERITYENQVDFDNHEPDPWMGFGIVIWLLGIFVITITMFD